MERNRRPPDVEEALSSMLWTPYPYQYSPSESDDDDTECTASTISKLHTKIVASDLYSITNQQIHSKPVRYRGNFASNYGYFVPKMYNHLSGELPSYEHIEKERTFSRYFFRNRIANINNSASIGVDTANNNNATCNSNGSSGSSGSSTSATNNNASCPSNAIYTIDKHSKCPTMVHSFTDDFLQYQVNHSVDIFHRYYFLCRIVMFRSLATDSLPPDHVRCICNNNSWATNAFAI